MTRKISDSDVEELIARFVKSQQRHQAAVRAENGPAANRSLDVTIRAAEALMSTPSGRDAFVQLLGSNETFVRLRAAQYVRRWAPDLAIPVLGRILADGIAQELSVNERLELLTSAKESLYAHFGIRSYDGNDLIAPLKAYGIDLPFKDGSKWR